MPFVDSWAWIEIFKGTERGSKALQFMRNSTNFTSALSLSEVAFWCSRSGLDFSIYSQAIYENAIILPIDERIAEAGGKSLKALREKSPGIGMIDSIILSQSILSREPLLTGDPHFRKLEGVQFIS